MNARETKFAARRAAGEEAGRWLHPTVDRALTEGHKEVTVSTRDLKDLLAYVQSVEARDKIAFQGHELGFAREEDMRQLLGGAVRGICVKRTKGAQFNILITYLALPAYVPEPEKELQGAEQ